MNAEIPFEKPVPIGVFDVSEEQVPVEAYKHRLIGKYAHELDNAEKTADSRQRRVLIEKRKAMSIEDKKRAAEQRTLHELAALEEEASFSKRIRLSLPEPQVSDGELQRIVKEGLAGESTRSMVETTTSMPQTASLISDYTPLLPGTATNGALKTPRAPVSRDLLKQSARDLLQLTNAETPLIGGEMTPLHNPRFAAGRRGEGAGAPQTPNTLLAHGTPRDTMSINTPRTNGKSFDAPVHQQILGRRRMEKCNY